MNLNNLYYYELVITNIKIMSINNQLRELIKSGTFAGILLIIAFTLYYYSFIYSKFYNRKCKFTNNFYRVS